MNGNTTHGCSNSNITVEYRAWKAMKCRCYTASFPKYKNYGARGIKVCRRWLNSFENFLADMGNRPSSKHSLDRINVNGNYGPSNCKWSIAKEQMNNTTRNNFITFNGEKLTISQWAEKIGIKNSTLKRRLYRKLPIERVLQASKLKRRTK